MKAVQLIEKYFWLFLIAGLLMGLIYPLYNDLLMRWLKPMLMLMLFFVFLKTDLIHVLKEIRDFKQMAFIVCIYMLVVPVLFYFLVSIFSRELAIGILLLISMPAGVSSPTLTDIVKGNTPLSLSITVVTSIIAPFTVPLLFRFVNINNVSIDVSLIFKDLLLLVFVPLILSQLIKKVFPDRVSNSRNLITAVNIIILFLIVYASIGSQRQVILDNFVQVIWQIGFLYLVFILLHLIGYMTGYGQPKENKVAMAIGLAYMNNGMAVVLAALYFKPAILVLMVLSEIPWNTLLGPFRRVLRYID